MPFLGSQPADQYQSLAKQTITGDGSTAYTLNRSVTNAYDMEVFINNVRQEPDTSYSASGNTITFTAAVTASDSCYLIYQGQSVGSINPPANSVGTNQVASNSITTAHMHTSFALPAQSSALDITTNTHANASVFKSTGHTQIMLQDTDASANDQFWGLQNSGGDFNILTCNDDRASGFVTPLTITQEGYNSTPLQPGVNVTPASTESGTYNNTANANQYCIWSSIRWQVGNSYNTSNGTFTAPIAGKYYVSFHSNWYNSGAGTWIMPQVYKNGSVFEQWYHTTAGHGSWIQIQGATIVDCAQNDTIRLYKQTQSGSGGGTDLGNYTSFVVRLVG